MCINVLGVRKGLSDPMQEWSYCEFVRSRRRDDCVAIVLVEILSVSLYYSRFLFEQCGVRYAGRLATFVFASCMDHG